MFHKRKRHARSHWPVTIGQSMLLIASFYLLSSVIGNPLQISFTVVGGLLMLFFWPIVAVVVALGIVKNRIRLSGQTNTAQGITLMMISMVLMLTGGFIFAFINNSL